MHNMTKKRLLLITGVSGAGIRTAVNFLEDLGAHCIDHLPLALVEPLLAMNTGHLEDKDIVLGIHLYEEVEIERLVRMVKELSSTVDVDLIFLTADLETILSRFETNRRRHPFSTPERSLTGSILAEMAFLEPIRKAAKVVIETTNTPPSDLARVLEQRYFSESLQRTLFVSIKSFGFKHGILRPADMIFDVRFLKNPFFTLGLRKQSGLDQAVQDFVLSDPNAMHFLAELEKLHTWLLPQFYQEGKHFLRIGIGCTGGQHRSVCIAEALGKRLLEQKIPAIRIDVSHRDFIPDKP